MKPYKFSDANLLLVGEGCNDLPAFSGEHEGVPFIVTGWMPSVEDKIAIVQDQPIRLRTQGSGFPPSTVYTVNQANEMNPTFIDDQPIDDIQMIKNYLRILTSVARPKVSELHDHNEIKGVVTEFNDQMKFAVNELINELVRIEDESKPKVFKEIDHSNDAPVVSKLFRLEDGSEVSENYLRNICSDLDSAIELTKIEVDECFFYDVDKSATRIR